VVYRLARQLGLSGFVHNDARGVTIEIQGEDSSIGEFLERLQGNDRPALAEIRNWQVTDVPLVPEESQFCIDQSDTTGTALAEVCADMAVCSDCLSEMQDKNDFRYRYPFINCTNCGPRYSIVKTIPYDRANTTMSVFKMCGRCASQYHDILDRRFHAQPVACRVCGPRIWLADPRGKTIETDCDRAISETAGLLLSGKIVAIKGIGGFHLAVNALDETAVRRLRRRKRRDHKPFALMTDSPEKISKYAIVCEAAKDILRSPQSPIVLLPKKKGSAIAPSVAEGVDTYGFMLCYAPLHHLIFQEQLEVLVMTSGNISDEPLICENDEALARLGEVADAFLLHDRQIYRRVDDSIVHFISDRPVLIRRARGYVPTPIQLERRCVEDIFAAGADLKNTFCFVKADQLICSEHIGDLEDARTYRHYVGSVKHLQRLFDIKPRVVACDLHPLYLSRSYALSAGCARVIEVQHHWAHIASVLAEHNLSGPVIGLACDGTGYGTDSRIWGCECLIATLGGFERFGHLDYYRLAGADTASKDAIRPVLGLLQYAYGKDFEQEDLTWLLDKITPDRRKVNFIIQQLNKQVNTVETSSLGRVFDAVAAMLGFGSYNHFEAQLPMALEAIAADNVEESYDFELRTAEGKPVVLSLRPLIKAIVSDIKNNVAAQLISAKFHNCLAAALVEMAGEARKESNLNTVALSGGVFCNRYLTNRLIRRLCENGFDVLFNEAVPSNDGGISVGQAAIAAYQLTKSGEKATATTLTER